MADRVIIVLLAVAAVVAVGASIAVNHGDPDDACRVPIGELPPCTPTTTTTGP